MTTMSRPRSFTEPRNEQGPGPLQIPEPQCRDTLALEQEEELTIDDARSVIGVSIGREQIRMKDPTTPAAEKSAALDRTNSWGFFEDGADDGQEEVLRNTIANSVTPDQQGSDSDHDLTPDEQLGKELALSDAQSSTVDFAMPSPWTTGPKEFFKDIKDTRNNAGGRSRSNSTNLLSDMTMRFFSNLSFPSVPSAPDFMKMRGKETSENMSVANNSRHGRSASLLTPRFPWATQNGQYPWYGARAGLSKGHGDASSVTRVTHDSRDQSSSQRSIDIKDVNSTSRTGVEPQRRTLSRNTALRKSASDESLLKSNLSRSSTIDDSEFANVSTQVNSRMKAITDSLQDTFPIPSINFQALKPDFSGPSAMSTVFGANSGKRSRSDSEGSTGSSRKLTRSKWPALDEAMEHLTGDVVIMGGYRGSVLRSAEFPHRQLWVPVKLGLNMRKANLEVGLNPEDEESMHERIFASGMLTHIGPVDMSRRLLKLLKHCKNAKEGKLRVHDYGYDWRLSPHLLSRQLEKFLEGLPCNQPGNSRPGRGATVLAHSLGGLITRHAVNRRPELFAGVSYVGTPQHCVNILGPLRNGDEVLMNSKVLTAQVNFTIRTSFLLLPESGQCFLDKNTGEQYNVDFFDPEMWSKYALSPCIAPTLPALNQVPRRSILGSISGSLTNLVPYSENQQDVISLEQKLESKAEDVAHPDNAVKMSMSPPPPPVLTTTIPIEEAKAYLKRTLAETLQFRKELTHIHDLQEKNMYPPISIMYSTSAPTVYGAKVVGRDGINRASAYDNLAFASGDGVVLARAAMAPKGYQVAEGGRVRTNRGHVGMLGDLQAVGQCVLALQQARARGVGLGVDKVES